MLTKKAVRVRTKIPDDYRLSIVTKRDCCCRRNGQEKYICPYCGKIFCTNCMLPASGKEVDYFHCPHCSDNGQKHKLKKYRK